MIKSLNGKTPKIAESAFVSQTALIIGDVEIGENCGVYPGAVIRGDFNSIKIGRNTDIEDLCVLHISTPMEIGENVVIGHSAVVQARRIGNNTLIGMHATVLDEVEIGNDCIIAAGSVVLPGTKIPSGSFVVGVPAEIKGKISPRQQELIPFHFQHYTPEFKRQCREQGL
ncbi:MAG: gamma carbonic anhydrase family protein [Chloroflexi bacterium]|nr:gamma carbonic anhydrase family protein [Chloroflexota bacterium]